MVLLLVGALVGFSLGVTGAGGSILAVPLLILALDMRPQEAMGVSLGAVSAAAMVGVLVRRHLHPPNWQFALGLSATGMLTAPVGRWAANMVSETAVLLLFSVLALYIAVKMWRSARLSLVDGAGSDSDGVGPRQQVEQPRVNYAMLLAAGFVLGVVGPYDTSNMPEIFMRFGYQGFNFLNYFISFGVCSK